MLSYYCLNTQNNLYDTLDSVRLFTYFILFQIVGYARRFMQAGVHTPASRINGFVLPPACECGKTTRKGARNYGKRIKQESPAILRGFCV